MRISSLRPGYLIRRLRQIAFCRQCPDCPWIASDAVLLLSEWLKPTDRGIEWGSGRSTLWIAKRVSYLLSVESDSVWHERVGAFLSVEKLVEKVDYRHVLCNVREQDEPIEHPYADVADEFPDGSFDFALVDGRIRLTCMRKALEKIKPGGLLILDNANRYVPNVFLGSNTTVNQPRSVPPNAAWTDLLKQLKDWRWINTSDGIWDTRFWIKPSS